jgi:hypothetical protein
MRPRGPLVLDSGPLLTYLCLRYLDEIDAKRPQRNQVLSEVRPVGWDVNQEERFLRYLEAHPRRLTTSHVVAEVLRLRTYSALKRSAEAFRRVALSGLAFVEERSVLGKDLDPELIVRHGVSDAGVVWLAHLESATLMTDDKELYSALPSDPRFTIVLTEHSLVEP